MAASVSSFCHVNPRGLYLKGRNIHPRLPVIKVQSFQEEGRSTNVVDSNLDVVKDRIEMVKVKERLERCCRCQYGWNYAAVYNPKLKRRKKLSNLVEFTGLVCGSVGLTCFSGTLFLCFVSMVLHLQ